MSVLAAPVGGRPRDPRIDAAVLRATTELLENVGYLKLSVAAIAERAGTNKPAIYRRWPTKAHLVHEAVFPVEGLVTETVDGDLRADLRALVALGAELLARPAARAALPGLIAEMMGDPVRHADVLSRLEAGRWTWLDRRLAAAAEAGEVRAGVASSTVLELVAGATLVAALLRGPADLDDGWVDGVVDLIMGGITT
ncbi:MAG TPA: TetR/AcrR family transcriptional regulator [Mycobacteriales bacterium]|nr:TetR/AcrR family transcriptional regulator [Mycobacteriales bacterium]